MTRPWWWSPPGPRIGRWRKNARATLRAFGFEAALIADVGVAGVHRLLAHAALLQAADAVVVVAGMEGALASVVGGLTAAPVVAVPTSVGYGAALEGITALLAMLSSCASGMVVVGIDNGFGAAFAVHRILGPRDRTSHDPAGQDGEGQDRGSGAEPTAGPMGHVPGPAATGDHGRLVALLRRHRRGHGARQPHRRRRRPEHHRARAGRPARQRLDPPGRTATRAGLACTHVRVRTRETQVVENLWAHRGAHH